jgi:mono/diheme cytochrome c family protein
MKRNKVSLLLILLISLSFFMTNCKHEFPDTNNGGTGGGTGGGGGVPVVSGTCSADTAYFATEILPMIISNCATTGCHDATTRKEGVQLTNYSTIMNYVRPSNAATSKLYTVCVRSGGERMPPPPMAALTQTQLSRMIVWINQGALNNQCNSGCDSTVFTYSGAVSVTMNTYCKGCHNPASLGGGIDLSTYATVKASVAGRLMGSINHTAGYSAMPKGSNKLSDCQIRQIQKWINAGTLNN